MGIEVEAIHHVCLAVRDRTAAEGFYMGVLGLERHNTVPFWLVLNDRSTLHLAPRTEDEADARPLRLQHFALQVPDLRAVLALLLRHGLRPFQADFHSNQQTLTDSADPLDFGTGTLFVRDPDGNLVEFLQVGHGLFAVEMVSRK